LVLEEELLSLLSRGVFHKESKDYITWRGDAKGVFSLKSAYTMLANQGIGPSNDVFR